jgi:hypothetical protein
MTDHEGSLIDYEEKKCDWGPRFYELLLIYSPCMPKRAFAVHYCSIPLRLDRTCLVSVCSLWTETEIGDDDRLKQ